MKEKLLFIITVIAVCALVLGGLIWLNTQLIPRMNAGEHFVVPWISARAFIFEGQSPYITPIAEQAQMMVYGHQAEEGAYPYYLDIPFYKLFLYFPFALIQDFNLALALWMSFAQLALFGMGFLSIHLSEWKPSALNSVLFYLTLFFSLYGFYPVLGGSGTVFIALAFLLALLALREGWDEVLGILLVFCSFYLEKGGLVFVLLLFWIVVEKRSKVLAVAAMSLVTLLIASFFLFPGWFMSFLGALLANSRADYGFLFGDLLQIWMPAAGGIIAQVSRWLFVVLIVMEWLAARGRNFQHLLWVAAFSVAIVPFLNIHSSPYFYTILLFPLPLIFKMIEDRWGKFTQWVAGFFLLLILSAWLLFTRIDNTLQLLTFLYPAFILVGLYWMRWWYLRAPRTWFDEAAKFKR